MAKKSTNKNLIQFFFLISGLVLIIASLLLLLIDMGQFSMMLIIFLMIIGILFIKLAMNYDKKKAIEYRDLFLIGVILIIIGLPIDNKMLYTLGIILLITGIVNKKKWSKNKNWKKLTPGEKQFKTIIAIILIVFAVAGICTYFLSA